MSHGSDPVGNGGATWVSDNWTMYLVPFGPCVNDFPTLGVDANGIYITVVGRTEGCSESAVNLAALPKSPFLDASALPVQDAIYKDIYPNGSPVVQPTVNCDPAGPDEPVWLISSLDANLLWYKGFVWSGGRPTFVAEGTLPITATCARGSVAPQLGATWGLNLWWQAGRVTMAIVRKLDGVPYVWTCRTISANRYGHNDDGLADRAAVEWFKIQTTPSVQIVDSVRIWDSTPSNPKSYFMPSLAVNKKGDMLLGFSGSSSNTYISAYYWGKLANGVAMPSPVCYFAGKDSFGYQEGRWGDYSYTSIDPDGLTFWTIQEYAETRYHAPPFPNAWGTRIVSVTPF